MAVANPPKPPPMMAMLRGRKVFDEVGGEEMSGMVGVVVRWVVWVVGCLVRGWVGDKDEDGLWYE